MLNLVRRCITTLIGKDDRDIRVQQVGYNGKAEDAEIYAPYGMSYNLPPDSLCLYVQIGGDQGNLVVLPDRSQDRVKDLKAGEVAFFNPLTKSRTIYRENGDIDVTVHGNVNLVVDGVANVEIPTTNWTGDINLTGEIVQTGTITNDQTTSNGILLDGHTHIGSPSAPLGGVTDTGVSK